MGWISVWSIDLAVLHGLDMSVNEGEIYQFLGRNGVGKSTALRIIMGVTQARVGGMHTKLALCLALASKPKLLLNEPTVGMDAVARREFLSTVGKSLEL